MTIKLFLPSNLTYLVKYLAKGKKVFEVKGATVGECLNHFVSLVPVIKNALFCESGDHLYQNVAVRVNGESADPEGLTKKVKDGDEIHIILKKHL